MDTETIDRAAEIAALGLTVDARFIPFSQSRNKGERSPSLNWSVTIKRNGRDVLTCDYSAGCGHCPAKASRAPATYRARDRRRADGKPYPGTTSSYRRPTEGERLADILDDLARDIRKGRSGEFVLRDYNGNTVGSAALTIKGAA